MRGQLGSGYQAALRDSWASGRGRQALLSPPWPGLLWLAAAKASPSMTAKYWLQMRRAGTQRGGREWGVGHLPGPPFSPCQGVFSIPTVVDFFSVRSKVPTSVKACKIHKGPQPANLLHQIPSGNASQLWIPSILHVLPHPAHMSTLPLHSGILRIRAVCALQRHTSYPVPR